MVTKLTMPDIEACVAELARSKRPTGWSVEVREDYMAARIDIVALHPELDPVRVRVSLKELKWSSYDAVSVLSRAYDKLIRKIEGTYAMHFRLQEVLRMVDGGELLDAHTLLRDVLVELSDRLVKSGELRADTLTPMETGRAVDALTTEAT